MANRMRKKRKATEPDDHHTKRSKGAGSEADSTTEATAGKIKRIFMKNFMCHDALEIQLNSNVNFIVGRNGSGKSAILTALVVGLGAKANVTSRGSSVKEFVKKGKSSALVEITLVNEGEMAYKPDTYGNTITVARTIGSTSGYKIKNAHGEIISTQKDELERITSEMNIQVDNPVSILNQDVSRTFLVTAGSKEKYDLFMKATYLDKIGANYRSAQTSSDEAKHQLNESKERLSVAKKEINELEKNVRMLESIEGVRAEHDTLKNELFWSLAISEERKLNQLQTSMEEHCNNVENHKEEIKTKVVKEKQIKGKIEDSKERVREIRNEAAGSSGAYTAAKNNFRCKTEAYAIKAGECKLLRANIKRGEKNIAILREGIQQHEADSNQVEDEKRKAEAKLNDLEKQLDNVEAMLRTKRTEQMHCDGNKKHLSQEEYTLKKELEQNDTKIRQKKRQLNALKVESDNAVTVFGPNMPRLLRRIKEEYDRARFKQMPRGPIGLYIKMKDPVWAAAVESFLGASALRSFCVNNTDDARTLSCIMKEVFRDEHIPPIIASRFLPTYNLYQKMAIRHNGSPTGFVGTAGMVINRLLAMCSRTPLTQVWSVFTIPYVEALLPPIFKLKNIASLIHDVSQNCTRAPGYLNLLEAMEISDPIIANCLIDQRGIESVLLIPTSQEACQMLSDVRKVPHNCKQALTQQGDSFFPDPNYKSYGGRRGIRAKFLQVSTTEAIRVLEEELSSAEIERMTVINQHKQVAQKLKAAKEAFNKVSANISMLVSRRSKIETTQQELLDTGPQCGMDDSSNSIAIFTAELNELLNRVECDSVKETQLQKEVSELQKEVHAAEEEVKQCRDLAQSVDTKLKPIEELIREQENELEMLRLNSQYDERRLLEAQQALQKITAEYERQQRVTSKIVADAAKICARINTQRSATEINRIIKELKANIQSIEEQWGSREELMVELDEKRKKYNDIQDFASAAEMANNQQQKRLECRRSLYSIMKKHIGVKVQHSFQSVLALRKYKGNLTVDHSNRLLTLEVNPVGSAKRITNDARCLSGGERSYSTVAFILALWDTVRLPFYFLDEFDVFMDKVNRRVIMDILLDHTKCHPSHQFVFLTPLDTSNILAEKHITIHQLAAPERAEHEEH